MAEVLKEWLSERLNRVIKWEPEEFGSMMKNGLIIANVLLSYHIINDEKYYLIRPDDTKSNWNYISAWLMELGINLSDSELKAILDGKGTVLLRLFYQLFLALDKKDRIDYLKRERKMVSNLVEKMGTRFKVDKIPEPEKSIVDNLSRPLLNEKYFIDWQRRKTEEVKETYDHIRHKYTKMLAKIEESKAKASFGSKKQQTFTSKEKEDMDKFALKYPCNFGDYKYEDLLNLEERALERKKSLVDSEWAKNYMDNLHTKINKKSDSEEFQKQIRNAISTSLWDLSVAEEENKLNNELAKKVLKLSRFEKQMCTQIMETKQQARNLTNNRIIAESEYADQRQHQFNQFLDNVREQIHLEVVEVDFEKHRQNILHKKLYAEKMKRKRQHYYEICYDTVLAIVDYAAKVAYFTKLIGGDDIPDHFILEWKNVFYKHQPIFELLTPTENILQEPGVEEETDAYIEDIVRLELERQDALNDSEFTEYHNYKHPWTLDLLIPNYDPESEERKVEYLGNRILGHMVYTLLEMKYPYPPPKPQASLPKFKTKAILRGLPDKSIVLAMQTLLDFRKILVIRVEAAINFCLRKFKAEMVGSVDIDLSYDKFITMAQEEEDKELLRQIKINDESINKEKDVLLAALMTGMPANAKQTQTPKTIPEEEITLSPAANLGQCVYKMLSFGDSLTDHVVSAMLLEYVRDHDNISGFVIVNYPNTYREAQILEETFSGHAPPDEEEIDDRDDIYLEESIIKHRKKNKDQYKNVRLSKLVNNPHTEREEKPFESYFTCYIKLKETADILQELVIWDLTEDNSELIDRFYAVLGLNYSMYYEVIEKDFLAQICQYIIGEFELPLNSFHGLFGEHVLSLLEFPCSDDRRAKSKIFKPEVFILPPNSKINKVEIESDLKIDKSCEGIDTVPEHNVMLQEEEEDEIIKRSIDEVKILPGEENWEYGHLPIAELIGVSLASCWEVVEKTYIKDMQQLFLAKRLQINCLVPYARFIKDKMEQIITLPSRKQDIVTQFQKEYNEFEDDWRDIKVSKNEWHCRVKELRSSLYNICDARKVFAEQQRFSLIVENWSMEELTTMVNTYISCMQAELNRFYLTYQAFHDFYFAMIKKLPATDRLTSKDLVKIYRETDDSSNKKSSEDKVFRQLKSNFQDLQLKNVEIDFGNNPFNVIIDNNVKLALKTIKELNESFKSIINRENAEIAKIVSPVKKKDEGSEESISPEQTYKHNALKCIEEWNMGSNGEMHRTNLRILALQYKCYCDMKMFNDHIHKTFVQVQNDIDSYYMNEIKSVDRLCKYLQMAIEQARKIPDTLILEHDTFVIDPNLLQFAPPETSNVTEEICEVSNEFTFRISQLANLRALFKFVAPTGITLHQAFIYILQDFIFYGKESCEGPLLPDVWRNIDPEQIPKLAFLLFGDTAYIDWRDFLIYCLNIPFPSVEELLQLRKKFRCKDPNSTELISRDDFINESLWFEDDYNSQDKLAQLRKNLVKHFLCELYEVDTDIMNYSAFLLAFCKHINPLEGFAMALSMAVGKKTCNFLSDCEEVVQKLINDKLYKDECLACALKCTNNFLDNLIANVVNICESTTITELEYVPEEVDKKGKKGKSAASVSKTKRSDTSHKRVSKISQSRVDARPTICTPCEGEIIYDEEKAPKKEKSGVNDTFYIDPNLAYTVSQAVLWNVLKICLPWHFQLIPDVKVTPHIEIVRKVLKKLEIDTENGDIFVSKFLAEPDICKLLHKVNKFTALDINEEIQKVTQ